jgi:ubiquinone/menaquinone biosynthesis C-methylase UbiE
VSYVMESGDETRRLLVQEQADFSREALRRVGLREGHRVLDAGCGPGGITEYMAGVVGPTGHVTGMDLSEERLGSARRLTAHHPQVRILSADIRRTGLPEASFDLAWSQFVLQYLPERWSALAELMRVTRPGGKVVISEFDGFGMDNWPMPPDLRAWCQRFTELIHSVVGLDVYVGRKVFHAMRQVGLTQVRVHLLPQYVIAGAADPSMCQDWETRFSALESVLAPLLGGVEEYRLMSRKYLELLADPDALKYSILLVTEGTRP